ncbi:MAG: hypothetical protein LC753_09070 [Acidobacteria bacterium]|nr:hypothetical protein [Acidobacteriota bacterium]MCA1650413.1 hypothetical protein [Acidobacteriota bacterium]
MRFHTALALAACVALSGALGAVAPPQITRIEFRPAPPEQGGGIIISLLGSGQCAYTIDFGDGQKERRSAELPDQVRHVYAPDKIYDLVATPEPPCEGTARARLDIQAIERGIWNITVKPGPSTEAPEVIVTIEGRGVCTVTVDFGDSKQQKIEGTLPATVNHIYPRNGTYEIHAVTEAPCRGDTRITVDVQRPPYSLR